MPQDIYVEPDGPAYVRARELVREISTARVNADVDLDTWNASAGAIAEELINDPTLLVAFVLASSSLTFMELVALKQAVGGQTIELLQDVFAKWESRRREGRYW
jgi:hypothetical protein